MCTTSAYKAKSYFHDHMIPSFIQQIKDLLFEQERRSPFFGKMMESYNCEKVSKLLVSTPLQTVCSVLAAPWEDDHHITKQVCSSPKQTLFFMIVSRVQ